MEFLSKLFGKGKKPQEEITDDEGKRHTAPKVSGNAGVSTTKNSIEKRKQMTTVCSICASTEGPFTQEMTGVTSSPYFIKCQSCNLNFPAISFDGTVGRSPSRSSFEKYFYECPDCGTLFYKAIPYAFLHFGVTECPNCNRDLPGGEDIEFLDSSKANQGVLMNTFKPDSLEELEPLYEKLVAQQPKLSKAIANVMLVETAKGYDIWVVCQGSDPATKRSLQPILMAIVDKKLSFFGSGLLKFAREEEGLTIIKQMKES